MLSGQKGSVNPNSHCTILDFLFVSPESWSQSSPSIMHFNCLALHREWQCNEIKAVKIMKNNTMAYQQNSPDQKDYKLNKQQSSLSLIQSFLVLVVELPALPCIYLVLCFYILVSNYELVIKSDAQLNELLTLI